MIEKRRPYDPEPKRAISLLQAAVLLGNLELAKRNPDVGFEDADRTYEEVFKTFADGKYVMVSTDILESALWACNLLNEQEKFFHPSGRTFDNFLGLLINRDETFDKEMNYIKPKVVVPKALPVGKTNVKG